MENGEDNAGEQQEEELESKQDDVLGKNELVEKEPKDAEYEGIIPVKKTVRMLFLRVAYLNSLFT